MKIESANGSKYWGPTPVGSPAQIIAWTWAVGPLWIDSLYLIMVTVTKWGILTVNCHYHKH